MPHTGRADVAQCRTYTCRLARVPRDTDVTATATNSDSCRTIRSSRGRGVRLRRGGVRVMPTPSAALDEPLRHAPTDGRRLRWTQHRAERRAAFVGGRSRRHRHLRRRGLGRADRRGGRRQPHRALPLLPRPGRPAAGHRRERRAAGARQRPAASCRSRRERTPHEIIHAAVGVIVGWLDEHPNLYYFLRNRTDASSLESVEKTLADTIAALLKMLMMFFGMQGDVAEPGAYGIVGFVEACRRLVAAAPHHAARRRSPSSSAPASGTCSRAPPATPASTSGTTSRCRSARSTAPPEVTP